MNRVAQEAHNRQAVVKLALRKGKSFAAKKYGVSLSSVKRWSKRYDGTWQSLKERSHRPRSHPRRHTEQEEAAIREAMDKAYFRYRWEGAYMAAKADGYTRSYSGFIYAAKLEASDKTSYILCIHVINAPLSAGPAGAHILCIN